MSASVILVNRNIGPVAIDCFLHENHRSDLVITSHPIEDGSSVNDHAYVAPKQLSIEVAGENASDTYNELVAFQSEREPFDVVTGLAVYPNMLIQAINVDRDKNSARIIRANIDLGEVVIVGTKNTISVGDQPLSANTGAAGDAVTQDRLTESVQRGDARASAIPSDENESILSRALS